MKKVLSPNFQAGSQESHEPRLLGSIVDEMLHGDSPLAKGYRQYIASQENGEADESRWHRNTDLGCDVKTILRSDQQMKTGKGYRGVLCRDAEAVVDEFLCRDAHYVFIETATPSTTKRNPQVFDGRYITVTRRDDGSLRPNFKPMPTAARLSVDNYAFEVYRELRGALKGLIEE